MSLALSGISPPLRIIPQEPVSPEEFWRISAENPELRMERAANGELVIMTPTHGGTGFRNAYIIRMLGNWTDGDGRGSALESNTGCELRDGSILCPDAAWVSHARWVPPAPDADTPVPCPEFVVELRSSSDRLNTLREKMQTWIANGCELAWLIDPSRKTIEIYRPNQQPEIQEGHTAVYGEGPVGGFVLELARIWG
jgi:Uma2 family endonuclease